MVCLTKGKGGVGANQRVESSIVNGTNSLNKGRSHTPHNNTFSVEAAHAERTKDQTKLTPSSVTVLNESDSFSYDADSQLLGIANVINLLIKRAVNNISGLGIYFQL